MNDALRICKEASWRSTRSHRKSTLRHATNTYRCDTCNAFSDLTLDLCNTLISVRTNDNTKYFLTDRASSANLRASAVACACFDSFC